MIEKEGKWVQVLETLPTPFHCLTIWHRNSNVLDASLSIVDLLAYFDVIAHFSLI